MLSQSPLHEVVPFRIAASTVGPPGYLTLPHLIRMLQEAAMRNTVRLNISSPELMERYNLSWILRRQRISCRAWPRMGDEVSVITAPSGFERGLLTYRDFHLRDANGETLLSASSEWLLMDMKSRRLKPIPPSIALLKRDLAPAAAHLEKPSGKIPAPTPPLTSRASEVAFYQLDFNDHLTNPVFPELMLEPLGHAFLSHNLPVEVDLMFYLEARHGQTITATTGQPTDGNPVRHALKRDNELLAAMETSWRPIKPV